MYFAHDKDIINLWSKETMSSYREMGSLDTRMAYDSLVTKRMKLCDL